MERRIFLKLLGLGGVWNLLADFGERVPIPEKQPNILFILIDDLTDWIKR